MLVMTACAAGAREPVPESKARKLLFYKRIDKESFVEELEMLKVAVADQAYHFQLHKVHIQSLRIQHHRLEEKVAAIESIDGSEAPRTGGASRLSSKIAGMLMKISNLESHITNHQENIQNLKYRYQVCLTREAYIERDMTSGEARRVQKEHRILTKLLKEMTAHNKKFLLLRDTILPELKAYVKQKEDNIKEIKQKIQHNEELGRQFTNDSYAHKKHVASAVSRASGLEQEARSLRAKLKYERENKRATQQKVWALAYHTSLVAKDN
ncbi:hypothetical protein KC19_VG271400 [Ceratodon purpureus]|uniref:Uncharacterized protein n=1 Tax=Ceratodon purpureus TaxID=3225 RepID=A0A8T0HU49_CERPU|nr:hypothetical protein KC19_VG271400 [Ceratodon purpureus]KAG0574560.1 hypothetical protein KC19_VG271400 [Ceratodon purpureus]